MLKTKIIKVEKEEEIVEEATCDFCGEKFDEVTTEMNGFGQLGISFGYGSSFDDDHFNLQICDKCFIKNFGEKLKKQLDEKGYHPETIKSILFGKKND